ncbi:MAG: hypothetical protein ACOYON_07045 [Fimbriimonas sp.]
MRDYERFRSILAPVAGVRFVRSQPGSDESKFRPSKASDPVDAELLEGEFCAIQVKDQQFSGFTHFLDGAQWVRPVAYHGLYPILFAHVSAALCERKERELAGPKPEQIRTTEMVLAPAGVLVRDPQVREVEVDKTDPLTKYHDLIGNERGALEKELARGFEDGCLLVDGGIEGIVEDNDPRVIVGLVKSHDTQYFASPERVQTIVDLRAGQRTSAFVRPVQAKNGKIATSFYLKMREDRHAGPFFGLARVEVAATPAMLGRLDEIAAWLLFERAPASLPDPRYDRLVYPIHLVEKFLKSRQPSEAMMSQITRL